jgi:hypothetical protein
MPAGQQKRVSHSAIARAERTSGSPQMHAQKLAAIRATFEQHGIELLDSNGVRLVSRQDL